MDSSHLLGVVIMPFKVIQGHRFWYQSKFHMRLPISEYKMLSYRREAALHGALEISPKVEHWNWETMIYGHYRSIFNHCDVIGLKICRIP